MSSLPGMTGTPKFIYELLVALRKRKESHCNITKTELHDYWCRITDNSFHSRTRIFFDLCDRNMDGKITKVEIKQVITLSASTNKLCITEEEAEEYASLIMVALDKRDRGYIELSQLEILFMESSRGSLSMNHIQQKSKGQDQPSNSQTMPFFEYAWGAAETLKFNMALILLPVCRNTVTWLRSNRALNSVIPFNDNINFHKVIQLCNLVHRKCVTVFYILHGGTHLACDFPRIAGCDRVMFRRTIAADFGNHQKLVFCVFLVFFSVNLSFIIVYLFGAIILKFVHVNQIMVHQSLSYTTSSAEVYSVQNGRLGEWVGYRGSYHGSFFIHVRYYTGGLLI